MRDPALNIAQSRPGGADFRRRPRPAPAVAGRDPGTAAVPAAPPPLQAIGTAALLQIGSALHIERADHLPGAARAVREVHLAAGKDGQVRWRAARAVDLAQARFADLIDDGVPAPEPARALGLPRTTAWRWAGKIALPGAANFPADAADGRSRAPGRVTAASDSSQVIDIARGMAAAAAP